MDAPTRADPPGAEDTASAAARATTAPIAFEPPTRSWRTPGDEERLDAASHPNFYEWREVFPFLRAVREAWPLVRREVLSRTGGGQLDAWVPWPERNLWRADEGHDWRVIPLLHTFPGDDPSRSTWMSGGSSWHSESREFRQNARSGGEAVRGNNKGTRRQVRSAS
jgi:hypothetical protein